MQANSEGWQPSPNDVNAGTGNYGACCNEMDIWEANSVSAAYTPHPCQSTGLTRCSGTACGTEGRYDTVCDPDGCDFNSFRMGDKSFYGAGMTVDTTRKFTVVTQFLTDDGSASGNLKEIRRIYVQDGKVIQNSKVNISGMDAYDSITGDFCDAQKSAFGDTTSFQSKGGLSGMGAALKRGMVLVLSIWDDHTVNMLWLDSDYPTDADASKPGIARGTCATTSGSPSDIENNSPNASVVYSNIRFGDLDSTYSDNPSATTSSVPSGTTPAPGATQTQFGQWWVEILSLVFEYLTLCWSGGIGWNGPTICASGTSCQQLNDFYSQCL